MVFTSYNKFYEISPPSLIFIGIKEFVLIHAKEKRKKKKTRRAEPVVKLGLSEF